MARGPGLLCARAALWWLQCNPTYLLSAALMALGAKLLLFNPDARSGDLRVILTTLAILQGYSLLVPAVAVVVQRSCRSPEDLPSLLLIAAAFWTGPLAATLELTEHDALLGRKLSAMAGLIALAQFLLVVRALGLRLSPFGTLAAGGSLALIAVAPVALRVDAVGGGTDEVALYGLWWLLAALMLLTVPAIRWHRRRARCDAARSDAADGSGSGAVSAALRTELAFLGITLAAGAAHLYAMNYAFFGHARVFYMAPVAVALTIGVVEALAPFRERRRSLIALSAVVPLLGLALSGPGFDAAFPLGRLPAALRDPRHAQLALAAVAWWHACVRLRAGLLLHAGTAAAAVLLARVAVLPGFEGGAPGTAAREPGSLLPLPLPALAAFCAAAYLLLCGLLRRRRAEAAAAVVAAGAGLTLLFAAELRAQPGLAYGVWGWTLLLAGHAAASRPGWLVRGLPLAMLLFATVSLELQPAVRETARLHAVLFASLLALAGEIWPRTRYRLVAVLAGGGYLLFLAGRLVGSGPYAAEALAVCAAFTLLAAGATISLHKPRLLALARRTSGPDPP